MCLSLSVPTILHSSRQCNVRLMFVICLECMRTWTFSMIGATTTLKINESKTNMLNVSFGKIIRFLLKS